MMFILSKWFLLFFLFNNPSDNALAAKEAPHPFYVSVTEINLNSGEKLLEISCKFFADDFEKTLEQNNKVQLDISSAKDKPSFDKFIPEYINKHLNLSVESKAATLSYVGYEKDNESVYCYFEVKNIISASRLAITNKLLYDLTHEQINIMHATVNGKRQSSKLSYPKVKADFKF